MKRVTKIFGVLWLLAGLEARGQIVILGKDARDKVLSQFFSNGGTSNTVVLIAGLNANFGSARLNSDMIENVLRGNSGARVLDGSFTGTNRFQLRVWDTNAAAFQLYDFVLLTNLPPTSNGVSRVGVPETLKYKMLDNFQMSSNGVVLAGIPHLNVSGYGNAIAGKVGTNRVLVLNNYALGSASTNWLDVVEGVVTEVK